MDSPVTPEAARAERRAFPRWSGEELQIFGRVRLRPGRDVVLINMSPGGALVEAGVRLMPGTSVVMHLTGGEQSVTIPGRVTRCEVCAVSADLGVCYRGAVAFADASGLEAIVHPAAGYEGNPGGTHGQMLPSHREARRECDPRPGNLRLNSGER